MLRKTLGDDRSEKRFIETISKQGYRFLPAVTRVPIAPDVYPELHDPSPAPEPTVSNHPALSPRSWHRHVGGIAVFTVIAAIAVVAVHVQSSVHADTTPRAFHSLAILPFDVTGSDPDGVQTGTRIANDMIESLGEMHRFAVRPASAAVKDGAREESPVSIGDRQKGDLVLTGAADIKQGHAHVTARLFGTDGEVLWSGTYDRPTSQIHDLEDQMKIEIAKSVLTEAAKSVPVERESAAAPGSRSPDPAARKLYMEGRYFWNKRTENGFRHSIECFQQAILKDPSYAGAYAGLADSYTLLASYGIEPPAEAYPNAKAAAARALQLDDNSAEAHTSLGMVALYYEWDWRAANREFRKALDLNPDSAVAHAWDALYFGAMGETPQALRQALWAQQLDPLSLAGNMDLGSAYYWNRQYDKAVLTYKHAIALDPYFARAHSRLGMVLIAQKDFAGAIHEFEETRRLSGPDPYIDGLIGYAEALRGDPKAARKLLAQLTGRSQQEYVPAFSLALLYIGLGDRDRAIDWLQRACLDHSTYMIFAKVDPLLDPVRSDQRFSALLKHMDLPELRADYEASTEATHPDASGAFLR
jgi:tetratricopeptide (TPR) repeat protein